jgi:pimeloyl-ACP methyl ester carboxylesterase
MSSAASPVPQFVLPRLPELRSATVFGCEIRYYDAGAGPVLLLIHGIGSDADEWAFCMEALSASHRVVALDLLGFGRSAKPVIEYSIEGYVEILERFMKAAGIERASLMGSSLGGWIASAFALRFPLKIDRLVLVDAAGLIADGDRLPVDLRVSTLRHMQEVFSFVFFDKRLASPVFVDLAYRQHLERGDGSTIQSVLRNLESGSERLDETIAALKLPTLIIWGEQDAMIPVSKGREFQRLIAGSRLEVIPQCGHLPAIEKPAELVRLALNFLSQ